MSLDRLYYLHEGLPRQAPGSDASTRDAIARLDLPRRPLRGLDVGCGPGRSALVLAQMPAASVVAIDIHQPYLDHLSAEASRLGLSAAIDPRLQSMANLRFQTGSFELIWAEGSAYFIGIRQSLANWFPWLTADGWAVFTELCWLSDVRPPELVAYWSRAYPAMATPQAHLASAAAIGYGKSMSWALPHSDWWDEYLNPLERRMEALEAEARYDPILSGLINESRQALDLFRRYPDSFGYVFHAVQKPTAR